MLKLFGKRITQKLNTVDLDDDLGDIELSEAIEKTFGIKIEDHEARQLVRVGQLYDLVSTKIASQKDFDPVWALTVQIVRECSGTPDSIDRETTFFPKLAQKRDFDS